MTKGVFIIANILQQLVSALFHLGRPEVLHMFTSKLKVAACLCHSKSTWTPCTHLGAA